MKKLATNQEVMDNLMSTFPGFNFGEIQEVGAAYVVPIVDTGEKRDYISFEEALKANVLKFYDTGNINKVIVENTGDRDVLILAGQIISSPGSQDRVFAETIFIPAYGKENVTVNCCEASKGIVPGTKFQNSTSHSPRSIKYCSIMTDVEHYTRQDEIWKKVSTYRTSQTAKGLYKSGKMTDKLDAIVNETKQTSKKLLEKAKLVDSQRGVVVLNNEAKLVGVEIFDSPETYKNLHEKIIESYLEDITEEKKEIPVSSLRDALLKELKRLSQLQINVKENEDRNLFRTDKSKLNGEVLFRKGDKKKKRIVLFRAGSKESA